MNIFSSNSLFTPLDLFPFIKSTIPTYEGNKEGGLKMSSINHSTLIEGFTTPPNSLNPILFPNTNQKPIDDYLTNLDQMIHNELDNEQTEIEKVLTGQYRLNEFNKTYSYRYKEYIKILIIIVIMIVFVSLFKKLFKIGWIYKSIYYILTILFISIGIILCYIVYNEISGHNLLIYDQLDYKSPEIQSSSTIQPSTSTTPPNTTSGGKRNIPCPDNIIQTCSPDTITNGNCSINSNNLSDFYFDR